MDDMVKRVKGFQEELSAMIKGSNIWKQVLFKFSPTWKHNDVKVVKETVVKSVNNSGYKFAIMEPKLEGIGSVINYWFRINESSSNWVAVGMCHKNIVVSKSYGFNFSSVGHGAYMVSANGGCWNNTRAEQNNTVKVIAIRVLLVEPHKGKTRGEGQFEVHNREDLLLQCYYFAFAVGVGREVDESVCGQRIYLLIFRSHKEHSNRQQLQIARVEVLMGSQH
ncbi:unnamed protein product [Sphagnum balticum]